VERKDQERNPLPLSSRKDCLVRRRTIKAIVAAALVALGMSATPAVAQAAPNAPVAHGVVTIQSQTHALDDEWVPYGYYFGRERCEETGEWTVRYGIASKYRCLQFGIIIYKLEIVLNPIQ
jgi:hypothetical protein